MAIHIAIYLLHTEIFFRVLNNHISTLSKIFETIMSNKRLLLFFHNFELVVNPWKRKRKS